MEGQLYCDAHAPPPQTMTSQEVEDKVHVSISENIPQFLRWHMEDQLPGQLMQPFDLMLQRNYTGQFQGFTKLQSVFTQQCHRNRQK